MAARTFTISDRSRNASSDKAAPLAFGGTSSIDVVLPKIVGSHLADASVSTRETIDEIRAMLPCLAVTDEELVNRIADHAIRIGLAVTFDSRDS